MGAYDHLTFPTVMALPYDQVTNGDQCHLGVLAIRQDKSNKRKALYLLLEIPMARKSNFASMSVAALLKMRDDIGEVLSRRASELKKELSQLADWGSKEAKAPNGRAARKGRKG